MIKVGQKLITKDFYISDGNDERRSYYSGGEIVEITDIRYGYPHPVEIMYKNEVHLFTFEEITDNFITLADWRQQQIDKILNDE